MTLFVSPSTASGATDSTRSTKPASLMNTVALNRPGSVKATVVNPPTFCVRAVALCFIAAFSAPCGVIHNWWMRSARKRGPGAGVLPATFQACVPLTYWSLRCSPVCG